MPAHSGAGRSGYGVHTDQADSHTPETERFVRDTASTVRGFDRMFPEYG